MHKYRIYFEPMDTLDSDLVISNPEFILDSWKYLKKTSKLNLPDISKILPIDQDGFPIDL